VLTRLPDNTPLFDMPAKMTKVFDADLRFAGIAKRDEQGRTVDIRALRHTFGTMLSKAGVPLQLIQKAMRHSDPRLTMGTYSHLELLDLSGAVAKLPDFTAPDKGLQKMTANSDRTVALSVALFPVKASESLASAGISAHSSAKALVPDNEDVGVTPDMSCERVTSGDTTTEWWAVQDLNLRPSACKAGRRIA